MSTWEAVVQGSKLAETERRRLELGIDPIEDPAAVLANEGVLVLAVDLPEAVSGLTFVKSSTVTCAVNESQPVTRQRFSLAHEYCHAVCDTASSPGIVSREGDRKDPREVRADAFAAAFLMPAEGVRSFVAREGKGGRSRAGIGDARIQVRESEAGYEQRRPTRARELGIWDVTCLASYFGVSRVATIWRVFNLRLISAKQREGLFEEESAGVGRQFASLVGELDSELRQPRPPRLAHAGQRLFSLALDALKAGEISRRKFVELAELAGLSEEEVYTLPFARREAE